MPFLLETCCKTCFSMFLSPPNPHHILILSPPYPHYIPSPSRTLQPPPGPSYPSQPLLLPPPIPLYLSPIRERVSLSSSKKCYRLTGKILC